MSNNKSEIEQKNNRRSKLSSTFSVANKLDIDALNKRGRNAANFSTSFGKRKEDEEEPTNKINTKPSELGEKETLEKKDEKNETKPELTRKEKFNANLKNTIKNKVISQTPLGELKQKILKLKMTLIFTGILCVLFIIIFFISAFIVIFDTYFSGITTYFGIPETDSQNNMSITDADGLLTNEDYLINPETGTNYTVEELVAELKKDNDCQKITFWSGISDWFDGIDGRYNDVCSYLRYIESYISEKEEEYDNLKLDRSLIISSIFYGYATQPEYLQYGDATNAEDIIFGTEYYKTLIDVLENGKITKDDIEAMVDNSILETSSSYYTWIVVDGNFRSVGKCIKENNASARYSLKKWQIFMRFGEEAAQAYEEEAMKDDNIISSDEECTGQISESELKDRIITAGNSGNAIIDNSVYRAIEEMQQLSGDTSIKLFEQKANTSGSEKDIFKDYITEDIHIEFDYKNGFVYNNFPAFKESFENNNINLEYDEAITPKEIETLIELIVDKKTMLNKVLMFEDGDQPGSYYGTYDGYSPVVTGAYCSDFLTAPLDSISVQLKDCDGKKLKTVTFKEYIMGVAYGEVSDTEDDYVKAQMLAAISYALNRRNNYKKGTTFTMKSGTCDQVFCEMDEGCSLKKSNIVCTKGGDKCDSCYSGGGSYHGKASQSLINKYATFYEEVKDFLVIDKSKEKVADTSYINVRQKEWEAKAKKGMSFTQIIQESYEESGKDFEVIRCSEIIEEETPSVEEQQPETYEEEKFGNIATEEYPEVSPDKGIFYGYSYNDEPDGKEITINPEWINNNITTVSTNCAKANWNENYNVNVQASKNYQKAFSNICNILTNGVKISNGTTCKYTIDDLQGGTTFVQKKMSSGSISDSSYGITQIWNHGKKITVNGKEYQPYGHDRSLEDYILFTNALDGEEDCRNINYILYEYAYKEAGFQWGGNWGRKGNGGSYNGMYYYVEY